MALTPEDRYKLDKWWLVQEIKYELLAIDPTEGAFDFKLRDSGPSKAIQAKLIKQLAFTNAVVIKEQNGDVYTLGSFTPGFVKAYNSLLLWFNDFEQLREHEVQTSSVIKPNDRVSIRLMKDGRNLSIATDDSVIILRRLTSGMPPDLLLGFLINNRPNSTVTLPELKRDIDGMASVKDISEVIRGAGFDKHLKELFFRQSGANTVELKNPIEIPYAQWQEIESKLLSNKIVKNRKN